jgi:RsiW-degrading membrane proteinase PrsW (M82 family)
MGNELPQWLSFALGFLSVGPLMLLFSTKAINDYGGPLGRLWQRLIEPRLDSVARRFFSFAVLSGMAGGLLAIPLVVWLNELYFPDFELAFRPGRPLAFTVQLAFVQAALFEEFAKNLIGLALALLICRAPADNTRLFLKSTPFLFAGVGLGFALLENSAYIGAYAAESPGGVFLGRALVATSAHAVDNLYFGLCLYTATRDNFARVVLQALAIVVLWHGIYDFFALPPVALSQWLTLAFLCVLVYITLSKLYRELPELRYRPLRLRSEVDAENAALSGMPTTAGPASGASQGGSYPPAGPVSVVGGESVAEILGEEEGMYRRLSVLPDSPPRFRSNFLSDAWGARLPSLATRPYQLAEFEDLSAELIALIACPAFRAGVPAPYQTEWAREEACWSAALASGVGEDLYIAAPQVWDSAIFADASAEIVTEMRAVGVDLTRTMPLRVLEFRAPDRFIWISQGLRALYGHELFVSFPHEHPMLRWFFLNLASYSPEQAPWLREFHAFYAPSSTFLGEPRDWLRFYLAVPLIDPARPRIAQEFAAIGVPAEDLPMQILMCCKSDGEYIARRGVPSYLQLLRYMNVPWHNDILRPALTT